MRSTAPQVPVMAGPSMSTVNRRAKASSRTRTGWPQARSLGYRQRSAGSDTSRGSSSSNSNRQRRKTPLRSPPRSPQPPKTHRSPRRHLRRPQSRSSPYRMGKRKMRSTERTSPASSSSTGIPKTTPSSRSLKPRASTGSRLSQKTRRPSPRHARSRTLSPSAASAHPTKKR